MPRRHVTVHPASLSRALLKAGLLFKKNTAGPEADREDVRQAREEWKAHRQPRMREESTAWSSSTKPAPRPR